jgi:hypothetical protein
MTHILREYWPVFAAAAVIEIWVVHRLRQMRLRVGRRFPLRWIVWTAIAVLCSVVGLGVESFLATARAYQTLGEGAQVDALDGPAARVETWWPLAAGLAVVLAGLARRPRTEAETAVLVAATGVLASWMVAMWLFLTNHQEAVFHLLVLPGGLGILASLIGFTAATVLWMAIGRWIWRAAA